MTDTLDDVACLIHIPIEGRLMHYNDCSYGLGIELSQTKLGLREEEANEKTQTQWGANISIPNLKKLYDRLLNKCNQLEDPTDEEGEDEEFCKTREYCIKAFLLSLVCVTIFANKNNKHVNVIWMKGMQDLYGVHT